MTGSPPPPLVIEISVERAPAGVASSAEDVVRTVRNDLERDPPPPGAVFRFLDMTFSDVETLCDAIVALESRWR